MANKLPNVPLQDGDERRHRLALATTLNELVKLYPREGSWTAVVRGSGTEGTYEIASQRCRYTRMARRVWLDIHITLAASVTGGGTGYIQITGAPYSKAADTNVIGACRLSGIDWTAGANLATSFITDSETSVLFLGETIDNAARSQVAISGLGANDIILGSICYETDDP